MQEVRHTPLDEEGEKFLREFFQGTKEKDIKAAMDKSVERLKQTSTVHSVKRVKVGRNEPCPCGSGIKFKKCCINKAVSV